MHTWNTREKLIEVQEIREQSPRNMLQEEAMLFLYWFFSLLLQHNGWGIAQGIEETYSVSLLYLNALLSFPTQKHSVSV